jgi:sugar phosphate isomerase/epimerase
MIKAGLTSISFRNLSVDEIIGNVLKAGLYAIEWGGDIHVPHGNIKTAENTRKKTEERGIVISSYGSYYRAGVSEKKGDAFKSVLLSAKALNAPCIRIWAGAKELEGSEISDLDDIIRDTYRIADMAESEGISIAFEYHGGTLTATNKSTYLLY